MKKFILALTATVLAAVAFSQSAIPAGQWSFGLNTGTAFAAGSRENTLFRGNSLASKFSAEYHFNWGGIGLSTGLLPGTLSDASISQFLTDRKIQAGQVTLTKANPFNSYFLLGPSFQLGKQILVRAQAQGGFFLNNPGSLSIVPNGSNRALYRFDAGKKNLFPGFAGSLQIAYPLSRNTKFTLGTDYLHTQSSIRLLDTQNGIDIPAEQNRPVRLFTAGIGILKTFGTRIQSPRDVASGQASGKRVLPTVNKKQETVSPRDVASGQASGKRVLPTVNKAQETVSPRDVASGQASGKRVLPTVNKRETLVSPRDPATGQASGKREFSIGEPGVQVADGENCGPVTQTTTYPDGRKETQTFSCPDDAWRFAKAMANNQMPSRISMNVTTPKQTQGATFGEKVNSGMQSAGNALANGTGLRVISGTLRKNSGGSAAGILTNQKPDASSGATSAEGPMAYFYSREAGSGQATGKRSRETGSGLATGRRQYEPFFAEGETGGCDNCAAAVKNNPLYKDKGKGGSNPLHNNLRGASAPDNDCDGVAGVRVDLINDADGGVIAQTLTGPCGEFWFARVPDGNYTVRVYGSISASKEYDITVAGKTTDVAGQFLYPNESWAVEIHNGPASEQRINTSRSNIRNIVIVEADTDGDGVNETTSVMASYGDGSTSDITAKAIINTSRSNIKQITIPLSAGSGNSESQRAGKAKYKNIVLKISEGDLNAEAEKWDGTRENITASINRTAAPQVSQYQLNTGDTDGDGMADLIWSPRSNVNGAAERKGWDGTVKGLSVATGDVNGDGVAEFLLGGALPGGQVISAALRPGNPIGGISIKGGKNPGGQMRTTTTNEFGEFEFTDWEPGNYRIEADLTYYIDETIKVAVGDLEGDGVASRKGWDGSVKGKQSQSSGNDPGQMNSRAADYNSSRSNKTASGVQPDVDGDGDPERAFNQNSSRSNHTYRARHIIEADTDGDGEWETRFLTLDDEIASISIGEPGVQRTKSQAIPSSNKEKKNAGPVKWSAPELNSSSRNGDPHVNKTSFALLLGNGNEANAVPRQRWKSKEVAVKTMSVTGGTVIIASAAAKDIPSSARISLNGLPPGQPVIKAVVWLVAGDGTVTERETDDNGRVSLNGLPPGEPYRLRVNLCLPADEDLLISTEASGNLQLKRCKHDTVKNAIQNVR